MQRLEKSMAWDCDDGVIVVIDTGRDGKGAGVGSDRITIAGLPIIELHCCSQTPLPTISQSTNSYPSSSLFITSTVVYSQDAAEYQEATRSR